jgi:hypothetical protein
VNKKQLSNLTYCRKRTAARFFESFFKRRISNSSDRRRAGCIPCIYSAIFRQCFLVNFGAACENQSKNQKNRSSYLVIIYNHMKQIIVLIGIALFCMGAAGCEENSEPDAKKIEAGSGNGANEPNDSDDPNDPGRKIYFKDYNLEGDAYITLAAGSWQLFAQSNEGVEQEIKDVYQQYGSRNLELVDCRDSVRTIRIAGVNRNDYGLEMVFEENSVINSIWLIYAEGDTLYYTSPEYPPRTTESPKNNGCGF